MSWYGRQNTFKRTLANPYFQTKSGSGGGGSPLAPATHPTDRSWRPADYAAIGGLLGFMGNDDDEAKDGNVAEAVRRSAAAIGTIDDEESGNLGGAVRRGLQAYGQGNSLPGWLSGWWPW